MAGISHQNDLTSLIMRATNPLNDADDPNLVQLICQEINNDLSKIQLAIRLVIHKMQSPHEREAFQALLILQACANKCGELFHTEIGKFRFLNEMIKLVSPKFAGNQTPYLIKKRVFELLYTWTIDLKHETKILEAYNMLKNQDLLKEDPQYIGSQIQVQPKLIQQSLSFEDEQKSRLLQRLLQSKKPEDISKANTIIKSMVREDDRKVERTSRRIVEIETALNNIKVLDDMLIQHKNGQSSSADLDLMKELYNSCHSLRANLYKIVSEMEDREEGFGELLKATDDLSTVMGKYKLQVERQTGADLNEDESFSTLPIPSQSISTDYSGRSLSLGGEESLLDLNLDSPPKQKARTVDYLGLDNLNLASDDSNVSKIASKELQDIFSQNNQNIPVNSDILMPSSTNEHSSLKDILMTNTGVFSDSDSYYLNLNVPSNNLDNFIASNSESVKPKSNLDILGSDLLKQSLPPNIAPVGAQFKPQDKVSLNQLKMVGKIDNPPTKNEFQIGSKDLEVISVECQTNGALGSEKDFYASKVYTNGSTNNLNKNSKEVSSFATAKNGVLKAKQEQNNFNIQLPQHPNENSFTATKILGAKNLIKDHIESNTTIDFITDTSTAQISDCNLYSKTELNFSTAGESTNDKLNLADDSDSSLLSDIVSIPKTTSPIVLHKEKQLEKINLEEAITTAKHVKKDSVKHFDTQKVQNQSEPLKEFISGISNIESSQKSLEKNTKIQLCEVRPLTSIQLKLEEIRPSKISPLPIFKNEAIDIILHFAENKVREDVNIGVLTVTSHCTSAISSYLMQAVVNKGCKVKLMTPSSTDLAEYSPFLPPPAITQIILIANPNQLNVSLKVMVSYLIGDDQFTDMGEVEKLPL